MSSVNRILFVLPRFVERNLRVLFIICNQLRAINYAQSIMRSQLRRKSSLKIYIAFARKFYELFDSIT